jgi:hypothetical protein
MMCVGDAFNGDKTVGAIRKLLTRLHIVLRISVCVELYAFRCVVMSAILLLCSYFIIKISELMFTLYEGFFKMCIKVILY